MTNQYGVWAASRLLFSRAETCVLLCVSERSLDHLIATNRIGSIKRGRRRLFTRDHLLNYAGSSLNEKL